jgi:hypothetical protein
MAVRRDALLSIGGFDPAFGPGARFPSADDVDLEVRLLLNGWQVYETADVAIVHHGFRTLAEGKAHTVRDWSALGACLAKPVRAGHPVAAGLALWLLLRRAFIPAVDGAPSKPLTGRRSDRASRGDSPCPSTGRRSSTGLSR